jgi:hypothetical protein
MASELQKRSTDEIERTSPEERATVFVRNTEAALIGPRWRRTARWLGLLIFVAGAALLVYVFLQAFNDFRVFSRPEELQRRINTIGGDGIGQSATAYVSVLGGALLRFLYLLLLGVLGSMIASRGIQFFMASESVIDEAVAGLSDEEI